MVRQATLSLQPIGLNRLFLSPVNHLPIISFLMILKMMILGLQTVVMGTGIEDVQVWEIPQMKGYLLWEQSGCSVSKDKTKALFTFDQLALDSPKSHDTIVLTGPCKGHERHQHFDKVWRTLHSHPKSHEFLRARNSSVTRMYYVSHHYES